MNVLCHSKFPEIAGIIKNCVVFVMNNVEMSVKRIVGLRLTSLPPIDSRGQSELVPKTEEADAMTKFDKANHCGKCELWKAQVPDSNIHPSKHYCTENTEL